MPCQSVVAARKDGLSMIHKSTAEGVTGGAEGEIQTCVID